MIRGEVSVPEIIVTETVETDFVDRRTHAFIFINLYVHFIVYKIHRID